MFNTKFNASGALAMALRFCVALVLCWAIETAPATIVVNSYRYAAVGGGGGGYALVAHTAAGGDASTVTSSAIDTTGATLIVVATVDFNSPGTVTDSKSNTWTALTVPSGAPPHGRLYYCVSPTVGSGHTFSYNGNFPCVAVAAFSGNQPSPFDVENGAFASGAATIQPGSITPSQNGELIVSGVGRYTGSTAFVIGSGMTITDAAANATPTVNIAMAYKFQATAAAINPTWDGTDVGELSAVIASFK